MILPSIVIIFMNVAEFCECGSNFPESSLDPCLKFLNTSFVTQAEMKSP